MISGGRQREVILSSGNVSVNNVVGGQVGHSPGHVSDNPQSLFRRYITSTLLQKAIKRTRLTILHDEHEGCGHDSVESNHVLVRRNQCGSPGLVESVAKGVVSE